MKTAEDCIFCKIVAGKIPSTKIYEDETVLAFMDIMPLNKGHLLVIPKEHLETVVEADPHLYGHLASVICKIAKAVHAAVEPDGMNVLQLNGKAANQVIPHLHMHIVPRWEGDGLTISAWDPVMGNSEEISATAETIKQKLSD